jgi:hypothetical protein
VRRQNPAGPVPGLVPQVSLMLLNGRLAKAKRSGLTAGVGVHVVDDAAQRRTLIIWMYIDGLEESRFTALVHVVCADRDPAGNKVPAQPMRWASCAGAT